MKTKILLNKIKMNKKKNSSYETRFVLAMYDIIKLKKQQNFSI